MVHNPTGMLPPLPHSESCVQEASRSCGRCYCSWWSHEDSWVVGRHQERRGESGAGVKQKSSPAHTTHTLHSCTSNTHKPYPTTHTNRTCTSLTVSFSFFGLLAGLPVMFFMDFRFLSNALSITSRRDFLRSVGGIVSGSLC